MMLDATISVDDEKGLLLKCFAAEDKEIKGKASYTVKSRKGKAVFEITAGDSVALRTAMNSITKMLTVIEKAKRIGKKNGQEGN